MPTRRLRRDTRGLSTIEYVILLVVVACVAIAGWRLFGHTSTGRTQQAQTQVGAIDQQTGAGAGSGGATASATGSRTRLDDATAVEQDAGETDEGFFTPTMLLGLALILVSLIFVVRWRRASKPGAGGGPRR